MPAVTRRRSIEAPREDLWRLISDPSHLPRWWPSVQRVEEASPEAWTKVLRSDKGTSLRADFTRESAEPPRRLVWRQEVEETPFQRFLASGRTEITLEPADGGGTEVCLRSVQRLRGLARLGGLMVRRATARQLEEALEGLDRIAGGRR